MVKQDMKSDEVGEAPALNENGKRSAQDANKEGTKRLKTKSWFRQPTAQELNRLQETENLFNSNLFRLQIDEILEEVKLKEKTEKKFADWFLQLKNHLLRIPDDDKEYDLTEQTLFKQLKVKLPVSCELKKTRCVFRFHKFKDVEIVGSFALGCAINSKLRIDIQITVPAETYTKNDSINYRYHKKRAAYLAYVASHLSKLECIEELQYSWLNACETKPVLDLKPAGKLGNHLSVRLNIICEAEAYKLHRFSCSRNNLRETWLLSSEMENTAGNADVGPPTPFYNSSILSDLTASANQEYLNNVLEKNENLKQAVVLLKIWLRQRNLNVSGHVVCSLVTYFVQNKRINNIMSSYQIVRNIWIALKTLQLDVKGISLHKGPEPIPISDFHTHFPVVFLDCTGHYNITWAMCKGTYQALRRESGLAVEMLDNGRINSFIPLFMTPVKPLYQFDHILRFKNFTSIKEAVLAKAPKEAIINYGVNRLALVTDTLHSLLVKGLGNRADLILQLVEADFSWSVKKTPEKVRGDGVEKLSFGLILNPDNAMNTVEKGPPANLPEAEIFRAFWGDKSELRRFQDGSITETCVWGGDSAAERRKLTAQIVDYLLQLKYGIPSSELFHISNQLDCLTARKQFSKSGVLYVEESSLEALQAFDSLRRDLRQLTHLPLDINAVYGTSSVFSYSDPLPCLPRCAVKAPWRRGATCAIKHMHKEDPVIPAYIPVANAIIELGHSGKWPGDIEAFRCLKAAFHLQIAERLYKQYSLPAQPYHTHIDVLKNGLVFRLSIAHPKEITLLRKDIEDGVAKYRESEESVNLQCDTVLLPRLRGALHGLHQKHPSFGPTVCLFKRWLSSHLLSHAHFPSTLAELVCARVFARAEPLSVPLSPTVGLLRVLHSLVDTEWATDVAVLDFNEDMTREEISTIEQQLSSSESRPPIRIATAYDGPLSGVWARGLSAPVLARAQALAHTTLNYAHTQLDSFNDNLLGAFVPSLAGYDVIIHLHPHLTPFVAERPDKTPEMRPLPDKYEEDIVPIVEFDPVRCYLDDLRNAYEEFALFFHDRYGGEVIAVLWKPEVSEYKDFQPLLANALVPVQVNGELKYKVNTTALVQDFRILGDGLVKDITVNA